MKSHEVLPATQAAPLPFNALFSVQRLTKGMMILLTSTTISRTFTVCLSHTQCPLFPNISVNKFKGKEMNKKFEMHTFFFCFISNKQCTLKLITLVRQTSPSFSKTFLRYAKLSYEQALIAQAGQACWPQDGNSRSATPALSSGRMAVISLLAHLTFRFILDYLYLNGV